MRAVSNNLLKLEIKLNLELNLILEQKELLWFQKSRSEWIALGYRNTRYFHRMVIIRKQRNKVLGLLDDNGVWCFDDELLKDMVLSFFEKIYSDEGWCQREPSLHGFLTIPASNMAHITRAISSENV